MADTIKAVRAEIKLGDIPISVYQLPDGSYALSLFQVFEVVAVEMKNYPRFMKQNRLEDNPCMAFNLPQFSINGGKVKPLTIEQASLIWTILSSQGNKAATGLIIAALAESIERRADSAFNVQRSEEERNLFFKTRQQGKYVRRTFTDSIKDYLENHPELSFNDVKFMYSNASDAVNLALFNRKSKRLFSDFNVDSKDLLRDHLTPLELRNVEHLEAMAMRLVDSLDMHPVKAVVEASSRMLIQPSDRTL